MMKRITLYLLALGALLTGAFSLGAQGTRQDTADVQYINSRLNDARTRLAVMLARRSTPIHDTVTVTVTKVHVDTVVVVVHDTVTVVRVDTVVKVDTLFRVDTVFVPAVPIPPDTTHPPLPDSQPPVPPDTSFAHPAELPRVTPSFAVPLPARSYVITGGLQAALDTAKSGDELRLSGTFVGNFVQRSCFGGWITIRTNAADALLPAPGVRIGPANFAALPVIATPNSDAALTVYGCHVRVLGVEITATTTAGVKGVSINYGLVWLGDSGKTASGAPGQISLDKVPQNIWLDRVYVHGLDSTSTQRCVAMNSGATTLSNSLLVNCHAAGYDAQAVGGWNGPGPYLIENNELVGSTENVMFGGGDPAIAGLSPSDITVRRNHIHKLASWHPTMGSSANVWPLKNLLELKNARRVLYENNVLENNYLGGQDCAVVFKSSQASATVSYPWEGTQDVTFRWNVVRNAPCGLNLQGYDQSGQLKTDVHTARVLAENNLFANIGAEGSSRLMQYTHDLADIVTRNNTFQHNGTRGTAITFDYGAGTAARLTWTNNVMTCGNPDNGCVFYSGGAIGTAALTQMAGSAWQFTNNAVVGGGSYVAKFPAGNTFPAVIPTTGGVDQAELARRTAGVVVP
jgi:hypothetical protein